MELRLHAVTDFLNEQAWFQQVKAKWEELDPQSRGYLKIAGSASAALIVLYLILSSVWGVHKLKKDLSEKTDLLALIDNANTEIRRLRDSGTPPPAPPAGSWSSYFETVASNAGIDKSILTVSAEKPGNTGEVAKEALYDLSLKKTTIRQVVKYAYTLENGSQPVKLRNLSIDTNADPSGYMDATISVSTFTLNEAKK
jgi:hypothetical protein